MDKRDASRRSSLRTFRLGRAFPKTAGIEVGLGAARRHQARVFGPTPSPHPYVTLVTDQPSRAGDTDDLKDRTMFPLPQLELLGRLLWCAWAFHPHAGP
jgi:hypothetical protein